MTKELIDRINELARKNKAEGLTPDEILERDKLRKEYLKQFRKGMETNILNNVYLVDADGNTEKLRKKKDR